MPTDDTLVLPGPARPVERHLLPTNTPWDNRVAAWEGVAESPVFARLAARVLELAAPTSTDSVVDLGAGTGLLTLPAAAQARRVVAVDYSQPMLDRLADRAQPNENIECVRADLRDLPLGDATADVVVSSYAFHHLDDAGKRLALAETRRILRPGGRLVICDMMFALSLRAADRRVVIGKLKLVARKGPAGFVRIARNGFRVATGRWEHPATAQRWHELLTAARFSAVEVCMIENEAGIAVGRKSREDGA